ncbi:hypothetical protein ACEZCY_02610 [Streptacidiphilus sp. N1-12]|uniref:Alpha/beta hydrolase n=3 Tax=Streptacidiphilus alkalitolerans TaxID=3342712 RepID=A0ABV6W7W4_9ACTN
MRAAEIVGVHGIGQSGTSEEQLTRDWRKALGRGIAEFTDLSGFPIALRVPHWTSLLVKGVDHLGPQDDPYGESMTPEEEQFVAEALGDIVGPQDLAYAEEQPLAVLGPPKLWSPRITRLLIAYDHRFPGGGGLVFVRRMREVRSYLTEPDLAANVRALVRDHVTATTSVVIGHSLGSVIAYDLFHHEDDAAGRTSGCLLGPAVDTLITCGSPLGIPSVRRLMKIKDSEHLHLPNHVRWINVHDPDDVVTGGIGLRRVAPGLVDAAVDNGLIDPHSAVRYLRSEPVARAVTGRRP